MVWLCSLCQKEEPFAVKKANLREKLKAILARHNVNFAQYQVVFYVGFDSCWISLHKNGAGTPVLPNQQFYQGPVMRQHEENTIDHIAREGFV
jgi:hypothetical protein